MDLSPLEAMEDGFARLACLIGNRVRARMLWHLLDGRAYTATELAVAADASAQGASNHIAKLLDAGLLALEKQGRHRYYRLANPAVAAVVESMAGLVPVESAHEAKNDPEGEVLAWARTCYDHLAGSFGVAVTDALVAKGYLTAADGRFETTPRGDAWFAGLGMDVAATRQRRRRRSFAHACLDWSERRHHLGGALGAALLAAMIDRRWIEKDRFTRAVTVTTRGREELRRGLGIDVGEALAHTGGRPDRRS